MKESKKILQIDVEKVIRSKSEKLARKVPRFVINYLKRIIHQDELNDILLRRGEATGVDFATEMVDEFNIRYNVHSKTELDPTKRYIFVSNHPLGGMDGIVLISYLGQKFDNKVRFVVNDLLMHIEPLKPVFVPVNKYGKMKHQSTNLFNEAFESENQILYFPAGLCSRLIKGEIKDLEWKKTFITKAIDSQRDIVPMYFSGRNSGFFYRLANFRKWLGIKFNIETLYLPDEMFKNKGKTFDLYIGEPIPFEQLNDGTHHKEWCRKIREKCYNLPK